MKAAVLHAPNQPLTIEDVEIDKPGRREVLIRTAVAGLCHSDLHFIEGKYPWPVPAVLGHESAGIVEAVGERRHLREAGRPRDHLPVGVLRPLRVLPDRAHVDLPDPRGQACPRARPSGCAGTASHLNQFLNLSSFAEQMLVHEHALVKIRADMPMDARRADRLRRDHRLRRGRAHREGRAGRHGGGDRLRRHRAVGDQRRADRRRGPHHRDRQGPGQARAGHEVRRDRRGRCLATGDPSAQVHGDDRRRRALLVRVHRA